MQAAVTTIRHALVAVTVRGSNEIADAGRGEAGPPPPLERQTPR